MASRGAGAGSSGGGSGVDTSRALQRLRVKDMPGVAACGFPVLPDSDDPTAPVDLMAWRTVLHGPPGTPYEGGVWRLRLVFPPQFPFKPPQVTFIDPMWHPNVDPLEGTICVDALGTEWAMFTTVSAVLETILPALLHTPNPQGPLNCEAARACANPREYAAQVRAHGGFTRPAA